MGGGGYSGGGYSGPSAEELERQRKAEEKQQAQEAMDQKKKNAALGWGSGRNSLLAAQGSGMEEQLKRKSLLGG